MDLTGWSVSQMTRTQRRRRRGQPEVKKINHCSTICLCWPQIAFADEKELEAKRQYQRKSDKIKTSWRLQPSRQRRRGLVALASTLMLRKLSELLMSRSLSEHFFMVKRKGLSLYLPEKKTWRFHRYGDQVLWRPAELVWGIWSLPKKWLDRAKYWILDQKALPLILPHWIVFWLFCGPS